MTNQASEDKLRELAERYAKDFGIRYEKIRINKKGSITYRQSGDNSGGWQESGSSVNLPMWVITRHYQLLRTEKLKLLAEVRERVVGEDERIDIQSEFDKIDVPHLETDKYPGLDGVRQASRNIYRNHQRVELAKLEAEL